jgi:hypothetical protein
MTHRKISATRGFVWLAQAWRLIWSAPQPLIPMTMWLCVGLLVPIISLFTLIMIAVFYGGVISALHKKIRFGHARMRDLFNGFQSLPHFWSLLVVGVPAVLLALAISLAFVTALGPDLAQQMAQGQQPDQKTIEALLPAISRGLLKLVPLGILVFWLLLVAVPRVILDGRHGISALLDAVRAIASNFLALLFFTLAYMTVMGVVTVLLAVPTSLLVMLGPIGVIAQAAFMMLIMTLALVLYLAAMYCAWLDMYAEQASDPNKAVEAQAASASTNTRTTHIEV